MKEKIGFIGLGIMGTPMALNLLNGGYEVNIFDFKAPTQELITAGAIVCASSQDVTGKSNIIITMVPDTPHVEAVLFGEKGIAQGLESSAKGKIIVDMSSISPMATKEFAKKIKFRFFHWSSEK